MNAEEIIQKFELNQSTWTPKGFHGNLHTMFPVGEEAVHFKSYFGDSVKNSLILFKDNFGTWNWHDSDMRRIREKFLKKVQAEPGYLKKHVSDWKKKLRIFNTKIAKVEKTDLKELSDHALLALYDGFYRAYVEEYTIATTFQDAFSMYAAEFLEPAFKDFFKSINREKSYPDDVAVLMAPTVESFVSEEVSDRLKILIQIHQKSALHNAFEQSSQAAMQKLSVFPAIQKHIQAHAKKHFFVKNNYAVQVRLDVPHFVASLCEQARAHPDPAMELRELKNQIKTNKAKKKKLIQELKLPKYLRLLIRITELFTFMQDTRKKYVLISNQYQREFFEEIGRRIAVPPQEMEYSVYPELREMLLEKKFDREKLRMRKQRSMLIQNQSGWWVFEGPVVEALAQKLFPSTNSISEIRGMTASLGKAVGRVRIILKTHDFINMQDGDVLVTSMTRPEFAPIMKKAAAIVTDEGGVTSHAAIVSRELGVPCIIGTKIATQVLKDGDIVEVDATAGIVKILNPSK